jgi:Rrf2 family nitric oxide-sensitive transcriptional repressor
LVIHIANANSGSATLRLTSFTDYGLRVLMRLAADPSSAVSTGELAAELRVSRNHLAKVISALAGGGLLRTRRGGGGGAELARPPETIRLGDVVALLEADQALVECLAEGKGGCTFLPDCRLKARLVRAERAFIDDLNGSTLADIVKRVATI